MIVDLDSDEINNLIDLIDEANAWWATPDADTIDLSARKKLDAARNSGVLR